MALKKTIAGYFNDKKEWIPQRDVDMHPLEDVYIRSYWAMNDVQKNMPQELTVKEEHDMLLEFGADYVKQQRAARNLQIQEHAKTLESAVVYNNECRAKWHEHCLKCETLNEDRDVFEKELYSAV